MSGQSRSSSKSRLSGKRVVNIPTRFLPTPSPVPKRHRVVERGEEAERTGKVKQPKPDSQSALAIITKPPPMPNYIESSFEENPESNASQPDESLDGSSDVSLPESSRLHQKDFSKHQKASSKGKPLVKSRSNSEEENLASQPDESLDGSSGVSLPESSRLHQKDSSKPQKASSKGKPLVKSRSNSEEESLASQQNESLDGSSDVSLPESSRVHEKDSSKPQKASSKGKTLVKTNGISQHFGDFSQKPSNIKASANKNGASLVPSSTAPTSSSVAASSSAAALSSAVALSSPAQSSSAPFIVPSPHELANLHWMTAQNNVLLKSMMTNKDKVNMRKFMRLESESEEDESSWTERFPLLNSTELEVVNKELANCKERRQQLLALLEDCTGNTADKFIFSCMRALLHAGATVNMTFKGRTGKVPFQSYREVWKCVKKTVQGKFEVQSATIASRVNRWLTQAKAKKPNGNKRQLQSDTRNNG